MDSVCEESSSCFHNDDLKRDPKFFTLLSLGGEGYEHMYMRGQCRFSVVEYRPPQKKS